MYVLVFRYRQCLGVSEHKARVMGLTQLLSTHFTEATSLSAHYQRQIHDHVTLLDQQNAIDAADSNKGGSSNAVFVQYPRNSNLYERPLLTTLFYCSMYHWESQPSPLTLKLHYRLSDRQYLWSVLRGRARVRHYHLPDQLSNLLQNKVGSPLL